MVVVVVVVVALASPFAGQPNQPLADGVVKWLVVQQSRRVVKPLVYKRVSALLLVVPWTLLRAKPVAVAMALFPKLSYARV